jgi:CBS domain containing-hemolysin-like protein
MTYQILLLLCLLFLSGFFSSAEIALFSISRVKARHIAKGPKKADKMIKKMKDDPHRLLSTILIGNNIANVAAAAIATSVAIKTFESNAVGIATGVMTLLILVFGEIFPKSLASRYNIPIARIVIIPLYWISIFFFPLIKLLDFIPFILGKVKDRPTVTEEELISIVEVVEEEGQIKQEEKELIRNIFEFDNTSTSEIMTPRSDMFVIEADNALPLKTIMKSGFTRIPVIEKNMDNVIGILNIKDFFMHVATGKTKPNIRNIMRQPYFIPENKKLDTLLHQFKQRKDHMAIVVDEHGGVSGLVTLEDVLEEIVGEICDETDKVEPHILKVKSNEWIVLGKSHVDDINKKIRMNIPDSKEYDTFSGYILDEIGRIPKEKEEFVIGQFNIAVKEMEGNRIREFIVKKIN